MVNRNSKITGYRDLSQSEIDLMNEIKAFGPQLESLVKKIEAHLGEQWSAAGEAVRGPDKDQKEYDRLGRAQPEPWAYNGEMRLKEGLMFLTRAVAQPESF
ncbi:MAG: Acb2/Tad1 domain-containing protein [Desulfuromonadaceae bacterium]